MRDFKATNTGNRVVINSASMADVKRLKLAILTEIRKSPLGIKLVGKTDDILEKEISFDGAIDFIKNTIIGLDTSEAIDSAVNACLEYCTYKTTYRINEALFDDLKEAREDYYEIVFACIEENLRPFIKSLVSMWKTLAPKLGESQALKHVLQTMML